MPKRFWTSTERDIEAERRMAAERDAAAAAELEAVPHHVRRDDTGITERIAEDPDLARLYRKIEKLRWVRWAVCAVALPAITGVVMAVNFISARAAGEERDRAEHQHLVDDVSALKREALEETSRLRDVQELERLLELRMKHLEPKDSK